jgi:hypothetical protein
MITLPDFVPLVKDQMMPRYFLHLRDGHDVLLDEEGGEFTSVEQLRRAMVVTARDIIAGDVIRGVLNLDLAIVARTSSGEGVERLAFTDVLTVEAGQSGHDLRRLAPVLGAAGR